ncbi:hypothetical protein ACRARG_04385 [Pseudooceanicola sp. C21-150M6]|uniref:hypothetical protein n=1 Tax=Pseudooceanicola sp. C21-150M6 TaxID=3434355 RepID=UPI003D7F210F
MRYEEEDARRGGRPALCLTASGGSPAGQGLKLNDMMADWGRRRAETSAREMVAAIRSPAREDRP